MIKLWRELESTKFLCLYIREKKLQELLKSLEIWHLLRMSCTNSYLKEVWQKKYLIKKARQLKVKISKIFYLME